MKLASIERITEIRDHNNADKLSIVKILGFQAVVKKGEFFSGDLCVFIQTDTIVPYEKWSEFLADKKDPNKPIRIRLSKFRGEYSQGLCLPLSVLPVKNNRYWTGGDILFDINDCEGVDVSSVLGVEKYEKPEPIGMGDCAGNFPSHLAPKTDEQNLASELGLLDELNANLPFIATLKCDGTSATYINTGDEFIVCSRNLKKKDGDNVYWNIARKYDLQNKVPVGYALQGEICGPAINGNKMGLKSPEFFAFNLFKIEGRQDMGRKELEKISVPCVPITNMIAFSGVGFDELQRMADADDLKYPNGSAAEGCVLRPIKPVMSAILLKSLSCKVLNRNYKEE